MNTNRPWSVRFGLQLVVLLAPLSFLSSAFAQTYDYEFMPADAWAGRAEAGEDDASSALAEGFQGLTAEVMKNTTIEPVDGAGGLDNVAPRLAVEEGPGGLEWDPSPTYRTRYSGGIDFPAGSSQLQGNNWFTKIPSIRKDMAQDKYLVRFDANTFRVYDRIPGTNPARYVGRYGNKNSVVVNNQFAVPSLYDIRGKTYSFNGANGDCTQISGLGGNNVTITFGGSTITVNQGTNVRRFTYTITSNRIDKIDIEEYISGTWYLYRRIDFTYFEVGGNAVEATPGDLIGIDELKKLSVPSGCTEPITPESCPNGFYKRRWVFKYFTGTYNATTNPGYPYQVKAVLGPQSVRDYEKQIPTPPDVYTQTTSQLANYVDRTYAYFSDRRIRDLDLKSSCGCGSGEGVYSYIKWDGSPGWDVNTLPTDFNTWYHRVTIRLPDPDGAGPLQSGSRIIDYNKYGQTRNDLTQETATNQGSRRWIRTWTRDTTGRLTESFSVKACTSYTDSTHLVTTNGTAGQRFQYAYDANNALSTIKLRNPSNGNLNLQRRKSLDLLTSGDRRRFVKRIDRVFRNEVTTDDTDFSHPDTANYATTKFDYVNYTSDSLAVKLRTTTVPVVSNGENGSGAAIVLRDWFETNGLHTWTKDGDAFVHYTAYDVNRRTTTKSVRNVNTSNPPAGVTPPADADFTSNFSTGSGLNIVTDMEYDTLRRITKQVSPTFKDDTNSSVNTTKRWWYTKLSSGDLVTIEYPHVDTTFYEAALTLTHQDFEGNVLTSALGDLLTGYRDTNLSDDFDPAQSTLNAAFHGTIVRRTVNTYDGSKLTQSDAWIVTAGPDQPSNKYTTTNTYDALGRQLTTKNAVGTITRWTYDVLGRKKSTKVGTLDDGQPGSNMTITEKLYYDGEVGPGPYPNTTVGDGNLTRNERYIDDTSPPRTTDYSYDYRQRLTGTTEPLGVYVTQSYDNRNSVLVTQRFQAQAGTLMSKSQNLYDSWGRIYEGKTSGVSGGVESGFVTARTWRNGRGAVIKQVTQGKLIHKTQYDGAGRVTNQAVSYDLGEVSYPTPPPYAAALDLAGDTVIEETRYAYKMNQGDPHADGMSPILVGRYARRHDGTGAGPLTVGPAGNARAQYELTWYDKLHRPTNVATYGTNGGADFVTWPTPSPPPNSTNDVLLHKTTYTVKGEVETVVTPNDNDAGPPPANRITEKSFYDDLGRIVKKVTNFVNGTPGTLSDVDRTVEMTYNGLNQTVDVTLRARPNTGEVDQVTRHLYGVTKGAGVSDSKIASNDLLKTVQNPDRGSGLPSTVDQESFAYNAQGQVIWRQDPNTTQHTVNYDDRGRLIHDRVTFFGPYVVGNAARISTIYDSLDRVTNVRSHNNSGTDTTGIINEVQYDYGMFNAVKSVWQAWSGAVITQPPGTLSPRVQYAYNFDPPASAMDGTLPLRRLSTTYPDTNNSTVITDVYNTGTDDTINRLSGQKHGTTWLYQESYFGLSHLVNRAFGDDIVEWTVLGAAGDYSGLDRFNRILDLLVKNTNNGLVINSYQYTYDFDSRILRRENSAPGSSAYLFDEGFTYDSLGRLTDNKRGDWTGADWYTLSNHECSTLDRSGNKTSYYSGPSTACGTTWTATYNASNEITAGGPYPSYEYLYDGNMTRIGSKVYEYDAWNRLSQVWSDQVGWFISVYDYNGLHQKISRLEASLPDTSYYYSLEGRVIEERDFWTGSVQRNYVWGTQQIDDLVLRDVSTPTYYVSDANFNVVTSFDSSAAVLERFAYGAFGEPKKYDAQWGSGAVITEDLYLFTGRQWHKEHSQYDYRSRSYDPQMGRFLQRDPILSGCDDSFGNAYPMTANDPVNFRDPSGSSREERARFIDAFLKRLNELGRQYQCGQLSFGEYRSLLRGLVNFADGFLNGIPAGQAGQGGQAGQDKDSTEPIRNSPYNCQLVGGGGAGLQAVQVEGFAKYMRFGANYFLSNTAVAGGNNSSQCCKFRQDIMWSRGAKPQHAGFGKQAFGDYTWYEDRGSLDERYGYRAGPHKINVPGIEAYSTYSLDQDEYSMSDKPTVNSSFTGSWYFRQYFLDTCFTPPKKLDIRMMFEINWTNNTHRFIYNAEQDSLDTLPSVDD